MRVWKIVQGLQRGMKLDGGVARELGLKIQKL
jgi:hypothetical protein